MIFVSTNGAGDRANFTKTQLNFYNLYTYFFYIYTCKINPLHNINKDFYNEILTT